MKSLLSAVVTLILVYGVIGRTPGEEAHVRQAEDYTTEDWTHINPVGGWTRGRDAVLKELREVHSAFLKGVTDTPEEMSVRFASSDVAIATVPSRVSTYTTPNGVRRENERQIRTFLVVRRGRKWLIMQDQNTIRG